MVAIIFCNVSIHAQAYAWGASFGGNGEDVIRAMAVDDSGNVYTTGYFTDTSDMDPTENVHSVTSSGFYDVFIQKVDNDGNLLWAKTLGSDFFDYGTGIEVDYNGNVYVCGVYQETVDFDPGTGVFELTSSGAEDIFVLKLNEEGDFIWAKSMGGEGYEEPVSVGIDSVGIDGNNNVYVAGYFSSPGDYDPGEDEYILNSNGSLDAFIVKLGESGGFLWAGNLGGTESDLCLGMDVDVNGDVYFSGSFNGSADFDISEGVAEYTSLGNSDAYVTKLDATGEHVYTATIGGTGSVISWDLALDGNGNVYVVGGFLGEFETGISEPVISGLGSENVFVSKINSLGTISWSACLLGDQFGNAYDVNTDPSGRVILAGYFADEIDFDPTEGEFVLSKESTEPFDAFVARFHSDGTLDYAANFGGSNFVEHHGVDTDAEGNVYLASAFQSTVDIDPFEGVDTVTAIDFRDSYIIKLIDNGAVGLSETKWERLMIYPNPATNHIRVQQSFGSMYRIFDMMGKVVHHGVISSPIVDIDQLPRGVYVIQVEGYHPEQFVKQ